MPSSSQNVITTPAAASATGILRRIRSLVGTGPQTAFSASLLLMSSTLLAGLLGLVRNKLIAYLFGAGLTVDAYNAAFELPDNVYYLLVGGVASTTFVKLLTQYQADGNEAEGDRALSNILNVMLVVLALALGVAEILAPWYVRVKFHDFHGSVDTARLCVHMTRLLLPGQLFFFAGGVFGSRLLVRKIFMYQAMQPILYNGGIIAGAVLLHGRMGIYSLPVGALGGALVGFLFINLFGAYRIGLRWSPQFDVRHPALREWVRLSLPLMLGQSLVTWDVWIRTYFAANVPGGISHMNYARQLFYAPMNILGPAAGAASLPFFASLWAAGDVGRFSGAVDRAISRLLSVGLLLTGLLIALAGPLVDLALRGGSFRRGDAADAVHLFTLFCLSLVFWTSQNLYARAFYGAGNTLTPMLSGTVVTVCSLPIYALLFHRMGIPGLIIASDVGIASHTVALAVLLHRKRMVSVAGLEFREIGKALFASICGAASIVLFLRMLPPASSHVANLVRLVAGSAVWLVIIYAVLRASRSLLPDALLRRKRNA